MGNDVSKTVFGGSVAMTNSSQLIAALEQSSQQDPRGTAPDGSDYMNFSGKRGAYEIGQNKDEVDPDEAWLVHIGNFEDGWICWKGGRPLATRLVPMGQAIPQVDLEEHGPFDTNRGDGWYQAKSLTAKSIDTGQQVYFKINSVSGVSEFANLQKQVVQRLRAGLPAWPVINFHKEKFRAQGFDNQKPILKVQGWLSDEKMAELGELMASEEDFDLEDLLSEDEPDNEALPPKGETEEQPPKRRTARRNKRL